MQVAGWSRIGNGTLLARRSNRTGYVAELQIDAYERVLETHLTEAQVLDLIEFLALALQAAIKSEGSPRG